MSSESNSRAKVLADWQQAMENREALLADPEGYTEQLVEKATQARIDGLISDEDLRELKEWADAALCWAVEELMNR